MKFLFAIPYRQLYFLQLENYELGRFFKLVPLSYSFSSPPRQELVWTPKLIAVENIALLLHVLFASVLGVFLSVSLVSALLYSLLFILVSFLFHFAFLALAVLFISPVDRIAKQRIILSAQKKLKENPNLKIIAIAGSYGKTTMKEVLIAVLAQKYKTLATPGNINTPVGISRTILNSLTPDTEVFVVEMGEHYPGDLAYLTKLFPPDVTVVTGIGEAHLERFGTFEKLVEGIFEVADGTKEHGLLVLNADNSHIVEAYSAHRGARDFSFFSSHNNPLSEFRVSGETFREDGSGISFSLAEGGESRGNFSTKLLGEYIAGVIVAGVVVGRRFGMQTEEVREAVSNVEPVPHRLQVVPSQNGVLVIDDSYNGNPEGVRYAIETLARFKDRRKVYITPGLVEMGKKGAEIHRHIGTQLAGVADIVVLIQNTVTPSIAQGLEESGFPKENIFWFNSATEAHSAIPNIVKSGDVVVFQNDWPDNYR